MTLPGTAGIVLAGGRSRRFGTDKLVHPIDGEPLLWRPIRALDAAGIRELIVVVSPAGPEPGLPPELAGAVRIVRDPEAFGGPLVGLRTGLRAALQPRVLVVAGDQPSLRPALLVLLAGPTAASDRPAAVVLLDPDGLPRPLPTALDRERALGAAEALLAAGERRLRAMLERLDVTAIPEAAWRVVDPDAGWTRDIDTIEDLAAPD